MTDSSIRRSLENAQSLASHATTGTLGAIARPAIIEATAIAGTAYLIDYLVAPPPLISGLTTLIICGLGSRQTTRRHLRTHLHHAAIVAATVILAAGTVLSNRGYAPVTIATSLAALFAALFIGYRSAFATPAPLPRSNP